MVKIWGSNNCLQCIESKNLCEQYKLDYEFIDIESSMDAKMDFFMKFPGINIMPQIEWNGRHIKSYNDFCSEIENTINGYGEERI